MSNLRTYLESSYPENGSVFLNFSNRPKTKKMAFFDDFLKFSAPPSGKKNKDSEKLLKQ